MPDLEEIKTAGLDKETQSWLKSADALFYTWHCYGCKMGADIAAATAFAEEYGSMPQLLTEYPPFDCDITAAAAKAGIGSSWCAHTHTLSLSHCLSFASQAFGCSH